VITIMSRYVNSTDKGGWPTRSLLASIPALERLGLLQMGHPRRYDRGDILMRHGEPGHEAFLIIEGCTKITGDNPEGHPALLAVRMAGDMVGELSILDGQPRSATVQAASLTRVQVMSGTDLRGFLAHHPVTEAAVQASVTAKLREAIRDRIELNGAPVTLRLTRVIWKLGNACGTTVPEGVLISAPLSQADLSSLVGTTEQSIRRTLSTLRDLGLVRSRYRELVITDMDRLREMAMGRSPEISQRRAQ
jgi:CRP/FNR family cyclic AMP-dependent transcriptional regulator